MTIQRIISYQSNGSSYDAILTVRDPARFQSFLNNPVNGIPQTPGPAQVSAVLSKAAPLLVSATLQENGQNQDGPNGEPAYQRFNDQGQLTLAKRYHNSQLQNGPNGEPAVQRFNDQGQLTVAERYQNGQNQDGPNGEPAYQRFNDRGVQTAVMRCQNGKCQDGPNGEPAIQHFNDQGQLTVAKRYQNDILIKTLTLQEIAAYVAARPAQKMPDPIAPAFSAAVAPIPVSTPAPAPPVAPAPAKKPYRIVNGHPVDYNGFPIK
jgi:hypothetical protein